MSLITPISPLAGDVSTDGTLIFSIPTAGLVSVSVTVNGLLAYQNGMFFFPYAISSTYSSGTFTLSPDLRVVDPEASVTVNAVYGSPSSDSYAAFFYPIPEYPDTPAEFEFGGTFVENMSGESLSPLLSGANGAVFVSPSFKETNIVNRIDIDSVEVRSVSYESYITIQNNQAPQQRPFLFGPPILLPSGRIYPPDNTDPGYVPVPNSSFTLIGTADKTASGVMYDSVSFVTTYIFY